jgi:hypothetical protein
VRRVDVLFIDARVTVEVPVEDQMLIDAAYDFAEAILAAIEPDIAHEMRTSGAWCKYCHRTETCAVRFGDTVGRAVAA